MQACDVIWNEQGKTTQWKSIIKSLNPSTPFCISLLLKVENLKKKQKNQDLIYLRNKILEN